MKKLLMIGIYGLLILGLSAGGTLYLRQQEAAKETAAKQTPDALPESAADLTAEVDVTQPLPPSNDVELPVAVRPGEMSVEEIVKYGLGLKDREAAIRKREEALRRTETQHRMVLADITGEQREVEGLVAQARDQRMAAEQFAAQAQKERLKSAALLKEVEERKQKIEMERQKAGSKPSADPGSNMEVNREANVKEMVAVFEGMSPESASAVIKQYANGGKMEMAVEILAKMEERKASSILDAIKDEKLNSELLAKFLELKKPIRL